MRIRSTESPHEFTQRLYEKIPIYELQGLTLNSSYIFTAGIEAIEFDQNELPDVKKAFRNHEWMAKLCLCRQLSVPLYSLAYQSESDRISVYEISSDRNTTVQATLYKTLGTQDFANWWGQLKGTEQSKPLYEASSRVSFFDRLLEKHDLSWGGNIDGFILNSKMKIDAIIESRYTKKNPLKAYDPAVFYPPHYTRAGDYKTWKPVVLLASKLRVPLFLFTFERESDEERMGFAVIDSISENDLKYQGTSPDKNIIEGIDHVGRQIMRNLLSDPPELH